MKLYISKIMAVAALAATLALNAADAGSTAGCVDFGKFTPPSSGGEFVEVNIKNNLISMVAKLVEKQEPQVAEMIRGLQMIRVNVIAMKEDNRKEILDRVESIRTQLDKLGWEQLVTVQNGKDNVRVSIKTKGDEAVEGLVVTVIGEDKQAVFVNIVGNLRPDKIALIAEKFNIEPLKKAAEAIKTN